MKRHDGIQEFALVADLWFLWGRPRAAGEILARFVKVDFV